MRVANTVELKNKTNEVLRHVIGGEPVIITLRGKPAAALTPLTETDLEEFVMRYATRAAAPPSAPALWKYTTSSSPWGTLYVAYGDRGVGYLDLAPSDTAFERGFRSRFGRAIQRDPKPPHDLLRTLQQSVLSLKAFRGPVDLSLVGPFERRVLERLREIPRGQVRTYRDIAREIGHPAATRAVGGACAKNPVPLLIPCHRVVRSDGGLGGYSLRGGVSLKRRLLAHEGVDVGRLRAS